ncbi:MAG: peptide/nickel transport system permease protein [Actinomycetota bacterium]|jgi:peptide/nickel transport system permease protein|nr:binding-protein-dependent transport system inner rane component [Glaciihabitans sp.]MDQ1542993.1 peptide/nickel transport system permease protein [Actinomycetota bacterium]
MSELILRGATTTTAPRPWARWRVSVSAVVLALIVLLCFVGPFLSPYGADQLDNGDALAQPSAAHWLGTDEIGRDMATRILTGGQLTLTIAFGSVLIALILGTIWGMVAAVRGGIVDEILMRLADISMAIPQVLFGLLCVAAVGPSLASLIIITGLLLTPSSARMARASVLQEISQDYYAAGVAYGAGQVRLMATEVLPNAAPGIASQAVINAASAIILEASLSFVGLGVQSPQASWGSLLQQGYGQIYSTPMYAIAPAVAILVTVLTVNLMADRVGQRKGIRGDR